jgi:hypothetical protein
MPIYDPLKEAIEIREQLASDKRKIGFFLGAGTSMALKLPGIVELTEIVDEKLIEPYKTQYANVKKELPKGANVEDALNRIRLYRELIGDSETQEYCGIKGKDGAKNLDIVVCKQISDAVDSIPKKITPHLILAHWIRSLRANREYPVELFTTNYDLLMEHALESIQVPFFDGFVGSVEPFFVPESIDARAKKDEGLNYYPPKSWTRLWKLHGSINWYTNETLRSRICRCSGKTTADGKEIIVFPSREKYAQSRKLPFIALQDRLRNFLANGETLLIILGYSFSDEHLNEIIFQCLRSNPHLAVTAFIFEKFSEKLEKHGSRHRKLTLYAPDKLCIGGVVSEWCEPSRKKKEGETWPFWDEKNKKFLLGDFVAFASYLETVVGFNIALISHSAEQDVLDEKSIVEGTD